MVAEARRRRTQAERHNGSEHALLAAAAELIAERVQDYIQERMHDVARDRPGDPDDITGLDLIRLSVDTGQHDGSVRADAEPGPTAVLLTGMIRGVTALLLTDSDITTWAGSERPVKPGSPRRSRQRVHRAYLGSLIR